MYSLNRAHCAMRTARSVVEPIGCCTQRQHPRGCIHTFHHSCTEGTPAICPIHLLGTAASLKFCPCTAKDEVQWAHHLATAAQKRTPPPHHPPEITQYDQPRRLYYHIGLCTLGSLSLDPSLDALPLFLNRALAKRQTANAHAPESQLLTVPSPGTTAASQSTHL